MTVSVVLPAYREAENLSNILPLIHQSLEQLDEPYEILVVDTMAPMDNTPEVCEANKAVYIPRTGGNLYGDAIRTGFAQAKGLYIAVMDADGSHDPKDIVRMYREIIKGDCDIVIGSRYCKGGYTDNNFILRMMSWALNVVYRVIFELQVKDVSDSFRIYKAKQLKGLSLECDNFDIVEEILVRLKYQIPNFKAKELPISFSKRAAGESKRDLWKFIISYLSTIRKLLGIRRTLSAGH